MVETSFRSVWRAARRVNSPSPHARGRLPLCAVLLAGSLATGAAPGGMRAQERPNPADEAGEPTPLAPFRVMGWNSPRALSMARRAIRARAYAFADSSLESFHASAEGHVYFLGEFQGDRELVRADQVALDVLWQSPDRALQTIVGRRSEMRLPTNIQYHIDHLSLVLDNFGERIRLGQGDEVWNALHPAAPEALDFYDYRLRDSLEIRVLDHTAQVYSLDVRPKDADGAAVVGTIFVDRVSGAIVRMRLTFTGASYRDEDLESIHLDLRSALWQGRYWLPAEQDVEIRRQLAWLNFPMGSVIRTHMRVLDYVLNEPLPVPIPAGERVASLPPDRLKSFDAWEEDLFDGPLSPDEHSDEELAASRQRARELIRPSALLGGAKLQAYLPDASSGLRARRSEGMLLGGGGIYRFNDRDRVSLWAGYGFESGHPEVRAEGVRQVDAWDFQATGRYRELVDVGDRAASGVVQSFALMLDAEDFTDPYFVSGAELAAHRVVAGGDARFSVAAERHESAELVVDGVLIGSRAARAIRPIDSGTLVTGRASASRTFSPVLGSAWRLDFKGEAAVTGLGDYGFTRATLAVDGGPARPGAWGWKARGMVGVSGGNLPAQRLFLLGGRGTIPGYPFRRYGGDRMALAQFEVSRAVAHPWVRLRVSGSAGWADLSEVGEEAAQRFGAFQTAGTQTSAGVGVGLFWDLVRLDLVRPLERVGPTLDEAGLDWVLLFSVDPRVWEVL